MQGVERAFDGGVSRGVFGGRSGGLRLPPGYIFRTGPDGVDTVGLSISDKANVRPQIWALLFDGSDVAYSDAQRIINIEASPYLNCGWELGGSTSKGYFLYTEGTSDAILSRAYQWAGETYPTDSHPAAVYFTDSLNQLPSTPIISNSITALDVNRPVAISISVGVEYRVNGGSWVSASGFVFAWDTVELRVTSPLAGQSDSATLTLGDITAEWLVSSVAINNAFEFVMRTTAPGETVTLPFSGTNNLSINWGDGNTETVTTANPAHVYSTAGDKSISITGTATIFNFNNTGNKLKLISVSNLGSLGFTSLNGAFFGCSNMTSFVCGDCDTSNVTLMSYMFYNCTVATVIDVSGFDTSAVTRFEFMFASCSVVAQLDVSGFDTSLVQRMNGMFSWALLTNPNVSVFSMIGVTTAADMLVGTAFSNANYDAALVAWSAQSLKSTVPFHAGAAKYTATTARGVLTGTFGWTITDGGAL